MVLGPPAGRQQRLPRRVDRDSKNHRPMLLCRSRRHGRRHRCRTADTAGRQRASQSRAEFRQAAVQFLRTCHGVVFQC